MPVRERSFWGAMALVLYVGAAHLQSAPDAPEAWAGLLLGALVLGLGWRLASAPALGADWIDATARRAAKGVAAGAAAVLTAELAPARPAFVAARAVGLALAATSAPIALSRIGALGGTSRTLDASNDAAWATSLLWMAAVGVAALRALSGDVVVDALTVDYAVLAASLGSVGIGMVASFRSFRARRYELGVAERAAGALWLSVVCLALGALASLMEVASPERLVPLASLASAIAFVACSNSQRPALVARVLRLLAAVTMLATPLMSIAVVIAYKAPTHAGAILFIVTALAVALGMFAPRIAERMAPARGRTVRALEQATRAAKAPDPRQAVILALSAIRDALGSGEGSAALYRFATNDRLVVDRAGYLHGEHAEVPLALVELASLEPERVVSTEVLRALQVRRGEVRPWLAWLDGRSAGAAALLVDDDVPIGLFLWPSAGRSEPLSYEEVRALRCLADHLAVAAGAEARLDRSREHAVETERDKLALSVEIDALRERLTREEARQRAAAVYLAERARRASYGPAARMALTTAEHLGARGEPVAVLQRPGGDALGWAAVVHLASPRQGQLMLIVDAMRREEQLLETWLEPRRSLLELARGGSLVVLDAQALPLEVQRAIGTGRREDTAVIAVLPEAPQAMLAAGMLDQHFAALFSDRLVVPPLLAERGEDLRPLSLHELARLGVQLRGEALGLALDAQRALSEYGWPGNEAELHAVLVRAARAATGPVVTLADVEEALGRRLVEVPSDSGPVRVPSGAMR
ncbi:MAG: hypothetical protein FJ095_03455 [Deltaproteobacteria bacterium]|nr:hypothetical protein [Deltaproteobacteria bacterium]